MGRKGQRQAREQDGGTQRGWTETRGGRDKEIDRVGEQTLEEASEPRRGQRRGMAGRGGREKRRRKWGDVRE